MTLAQRLLTTAAIIGALLVAIWVLNARLDAAQAGQDLAKANERTALQANADLNATITTLSARLLEMHAAEQRLATTKTQLTAALRHSELQRETLRRENETYRLWADQSLPDAVVRLRERPAFTGAQPYLDWLSARDAVPASGYGTSTERPTEQ